MSHSVDPQDSTEQPPLAWSADLARSIAGQRQRLKALARGHEMRVENLERTLAKAIETLRAAEGGALEAHPAAHPEQPQLRVDVAAPEARHEQPREEAPVRNPHAVVSMDWESHKKRFLAALEEENAKVQATGKDDSRRADDRLTIDGTIRITDAVVAEKDREIAHLKQVIEQHETAAKEALALQEAAMASDDPLVLQRKRLQDAETMLTEKQRLAEVELSQQRARLARQAAELEELRRVLESERAHWDSEHTETPISGVGDNAKQRGRWLARLGLKDTDNGQADRSKSR